MDINRSYNSVWDFDQNRRFRVPEKSIEEIRQHFLEEDVEAIGSSSRIPLPEYECSSTNSMSGQMQIGSSQVGREVRRRKSKPWAEEEVGKEERQIKARPWSVEEVGREDQRRRAKPWSEEEHRLFLLGLQRLGRGDWKGISRNFVLSKTPVQVASHAQKYFERLKTSDKKRPSIHDITTTGESCGSTPQEPITGMKPRGSCSGRSWKEHPQPPMGPGPEQSYNSGPPCLPPPPPAHSSSSGEGVYYGVNALTPGLLFPDDMVGLASVDILYPGLRGRMF